MGKLHNHNYYDASNMCLCLFKTKEKKCIEESILICNISRNVVFPGTHDEMTKWWQRSCNIPLPPYLLFIRTRPNSITSRNLSYYLNQYCCHRHRNTLLWFHRHSWSVLLTNRCYLHTGHSN